ncbi:MAG TPA: GNAT family N-acetyltransferase [Spirochaetia bacterium]|nr:GNAT family N-acetyltransferase [Spirochaetia bacterium]
MLVRLYELPPPVESPNGVEIRRPLAPEKGIVLDWIRGHFSAGWANEAEVTFGRLPITMHIALERGAIVGFACYDATCRDFFGPTGVAPDCRGRGIGRALLVCSLYAMREAGYAYAIIGGAGPGDFYARSVGAFPIEGSSPGVYRGMLKP